jgi:hypothetical protein
VITLEETSKSIFNPFKWPIMCSAGVLAIFQYAFFSFLAFLAFPESFDPVNDFLSKLGNYEKNPDGAIFYFIAIIFSGMLTVVFYWGFYSFYSKEKFASLLKVILFLGIVNGISIFMSGVFAESVNFPLHFLFSFLIFFTLLPLILITNIYIWKSQNYSKITSMLGFIAATIDFIFILIAIFGGDLFNDAAIMEWLSLFSYFIWMLLIIYNVIKVSISENKNEFTVKTL